MISILEKSIEFITLLIGVISWDSCKPFYLRLIIFLLAVTCINEIVIVPNLSNSNIAYNFFSLVDVPIWLYIFLKMHFASKKKIILNIISLVVFMYSIIDVFFITGISFLHINSLMFYDMIILLFAGSFLYILLKREYHSVASDPLFWISSACIGYHSLLFLNFITLKLPRVYWTPYAYNVWDTVDLSANIFYYLLLSIGLIKCINYKSQQISFQ